MITVFIGIMVVCFVAVALICAVNSGPVDKRNWSQAKENEQLRREGLDPKVVAGPGEEA